MAQKPQNTSFIAFVQQNRAFFLQGLVAAVLMSLGLYVPPLALLSYVAPAPLLMAALGGSDEGFWLSAAASFCVLFVLAPPSYIVFFAFLCLAPAYLLLKVRGTGKKTKKHSFVVKGNVGKEWRVFEVRLGYAWITFLCALTMLMVHFLPPLKVLLKTLPLWMLKNPTFKETLPNVWPFMPALFSLAWGGVLWANVSLARRLLRFSDKTLQLNYTVWHVPSFFYAVFFGVLILSSLWVGHERFVWLNFLIVLSTVFFFEGCVVLKHLFAYVGLQKFVKPFMMIAGMMVVPLLLIVVLGVIEPLTMLKQRLKRS